MVIAVVAKVKGKITEKFLGRNQMPFRRLE